MVSTSSKYCVNLFSKEPNTSHHKYSSCNISGIWWSLLHVILENWILLLLISMNKIYIKKRNLKQLKKNEDQDEVSSAKTKRLECLADIKRKRKMHKKLVRDEDADQYCVNINNAISTCSTSHNFNNNTLQSSFSQEINSKKIDPASCNNSEKISREEKKLQYYLDMIQRQEDEENKQKIKQEVKRFK